MEEMVYAESTYTPHKSQVYLFIHNRQAWKAHSGVVTGRNVALGRNLLEQVTCSRGLCLEERCPLCGTWKVTVRLELLLTHSGSKA